MAIRQYTVTIETPEAEDDFNYQVTITRHGKTVSEFTHPLTYARDSIGAAIFRDMEEEDDRPRRKGRLKARLDAAIQAGDDEEGTHL